MRGRGVSMDFEPWMLKKAGASEGIEKAAYFRANKDSCGEIDLRVASSFDPVFYRFAYRDLSTLGDDEALAHFWTVGWLEGRNPNNWFDTSSYLEINEDVRKAGFNPLLHYVEWGQAERRLFREPIPVRQINQRLFAEPSLDWFALVQPVFDAAYYAAQFDEPIPVGLNLLAHYLYRGWREQRSPNSLYRRAAMPQQIGDLAHFVPPIVIELFAEFRPLAVVRKTRSRPTETLRVVGTAPDGLLTVAKRRRVSADRGPIDVSGKMGALEEIASEFDSRYYLAVNPDVRDAGVDPVEHYFHTGWREGRDPTAWFSTRFYLRSNPDVAAAQVNPFWHYLVAGKAERRAPRRQANARRDALETLETPEKRSARYVMPDHTRLRWEDLCKLIVEAVAGRDGLVWSSSHDCYPTIVGGTQIFIADEQQMFATLNMAYIHASPLTASLLMNSTVPEATLTRLVINGAIVGVASDAEIAAALTAVGGQLPDSRTYIVHSVLGNSLSGLLAIFRALSAPDAYFWLHDYSSVCAGYNLMRNDIAYCHAPPVGSQACRICIYGQSRANHVALTRELFSACDFTVLAPSEVALTIWKAASDLPHRGSVVIGHCEIEGLRIGADPRPPESIGMVDEPVRVAFVGYPTVQKGWPSFSDVVDTTIGQGAYRFYHFAILGSSTHSDRILFVEAKVTPGHRDAMTDLLEAHAVDLVVMAAPWPETFSYVLYEALAAGCHVVTLASSGNVAEVVKKTGRGVVFDSEQEMSAFFQSQSAVSYVRARARHGIERGRLVQKGTTAALHARQNAEP
jgi:glycosyltransferase involved in cell wall biosynthesis